MNPFAWQIGTAPACSGERPSSFNAGRGAVDCLDAFDLPEHYRRLKCGVS